MNRFMVLLCAVLLCSQAHGWGATGHRVAAQIAAGYLAPEARIAVAEILGPETLAEASTWPDFMRANPSEFWQVTANPWHYLTVPPGKSYSEVGAPPEGDALTALEGFAETLRDPESSTDDKALALRFAVHIIGDLHQPLHVGNGSDRGGNDFRITYFGQGSNLHRLWDSQMIDRRQLSYTEMSDWLQAKISPADYRGWNSADPLVWIAESADLRDRIYPDDTELGWDYGFRWTDAIDRRLSMAGVRTAAYLNRLFTD
ncbi:MAG: S1/P1 nuclease [Wenzhouxiangellaceae bacterium]|nr:S1/P1 nuclease [Wenzhouxiangellaceae bacterium]